MARGGGVQFTSSTSQSVKAKILFVDDEPNVLEAYQRNLRKRYSLEAATSCEMALELIAQRGPFAVLVADMQMTVMNGI